MLSAITATSQRCTVPTRVGCDTQETRPRERAERPGADTHQESTSRPPCGKRHQREGGHTIGALHRVVIDADGDAASLRSSRLRSDMAMAYTSQGMTQAQPEPTTGATSRGGVAPSGATMAARSQSRLNDDHCAQHDELPLQSRNGRDDERPCCDIQLPGRHDGPHVGGRRSR
jgi:hypothetical protein